jgi:uncharacterized protein YdhG (YjbR/CyaY superfamily)
MDRPSPSGSRTTLSPADLASADLGGTTSVDAPAAVEAYLAALPATARAEVEAVRARIRAVVPEATESISYGIPTFSLGGRHLIYVAAWKQHFSIYPVPRGDVALQAALAPYEAGRGTLKFAYGTAIPDGLVERIVRALITERDRSTE